jgi:hypothetical protein
MIFKPERKREREFIPPSPDKFNPSEQIEKLVEQYSELEEVRQKCIEEGMSEEEILDELLIYPKLLANNPYKVEEIKELSKRGYKPSQIKEILKIVEKQE